MVIQPTIQERIDQNRKINSVLYDIDRIGRVYCRECREDCTNCNIPVFFEQAKACMKQVRNRNEYYIEEGIECSKEK